MDSSLFDIEFPKVASLKMNKSAEEYFNYPFCYPIHIENEDQLYEIAKWAEDNFNAKNWAIDRNIIYDSQYLTCNYKINFYFKFREDFAAFKLRWL